LTASRRTPSAVTACAHGSRQADSRAEGYGGSVAVTRVPPRAAVDREPAAERFDPVREPAQAAALGARASDAVVADLHMQQRVLDPDPHRGPSRVDVLDHVRQRLAITK
jgi:hypothetical protein